MTEPENDNTGPVTPFAWMGWQVTMPDTWRPLKLTGEWRQGTVVVGDGAYAIFQMKWWRPPQKSLDPDKWMRRRLRQETGAKEPDPDPPVPDAVETACWHGLNRGDPPRVLWYGCSTTAGMMLEMLINAEAPGDRRDCVLENLLPSLTLTPPDQPLQTVAFNTRFITPPGFQLERWQLKLGDQSLRFTTVDGHRQLTLRQVYPARLALSRNTLKNWLKNNPFPDKRRYTRHENIETVHLKTPAAISEGLRASGTRRNPWPLGWLRPRTVLRLAAHDRDNDRVLTAMHESRGEIDETLARECLVHMGPWKAERKKEKTQR